MGFGVICFYADKRLCFCFLFLFYCFQAVSLSLELTKVDGVVMLEKGVVAIGIAIYD